MQVMDDRLHNTMMTFLDDGDDDNDNDNDDDDADYNLMEKSGRLKRAATTPSPLFHPHNTKLQHRSEYIAQ